MMVTMKAEMIAIVCRWTEQRNFEAVDLMSSGAMEVDVHH